jgi:dimethylglycine dehydrogenase
MDKPEFLGREAYAAIADKEPRWKLVNMSVEVTNADALGGEPVFAKDGTAVGQVSSGGYGYSVEKSLALGFVKSEYAIAGTKLDIAILGKPHSAIVLDAAAFDPAGDRLRS